MASAPRSYKDQLQGWLGKNKLKSSYNESTNAAGQFVCELTVSGCSFKPIGVGARKAAAKEDAAAQLVQWLRRAGRWEPSEAASPSRAVPLPAADDTSRNSNQNPKSALNIRLQSMQVPCKYSTPPSVNGGFECTLEIDLPDGRVKFRSTGLSTKEAERACARDALLHLDRRPGGQLRRTVSAAPAQADGVPPLPRSASLPPPPPPPVPARLTHLMDSSEVVTPRHILKVSMKIGNLRKTIGRWLGLDPPDIENCCLKEDDPHEINRKILGVWRERESRAATVGRLCRALWECGATEAVHTLAEEPSTPQP